MARWIVPAMIVTLLSGCQSEAPPQAVTPAPQRVATAAQATPAASAEESPSSAAEAPFVYAVAGRRDPFEPLILQRPTAIEPDSAPLTPLQTFEVSQFRLIGIIVGKGEPRAMVMAPDGKSYILSKGVKIGRNSGAVVEIRSDVVLVEERYLDFSGDVRKNVVEITLPKRGGA